MGIIFVQNSYGAVQHAGISVCCANLLQCLGQLWQSFVFPNAIELLT